jgi:hypothetical protein
MKKIIITSCILLGILCLNNAQAQTSAGVKGGINFTNISNHTGADRVSGNVGVFVHAQLNNNWCIQPELLYSGQGRRFDSQEGEGTVALNYIQLPVMLQYFPVKGFYLEAGPQVGLLTNASSKMDNGTKDNRNDDYKKADVTLNVGAGVNATRRIGIFARYGFGLTDITKYDNETHRNMVGQVGVSLKLNH